MSRKKKWDNAVDVSKKKKRHDISPKFMGSWFILFFKEHKKWSNILKDNMVSDVRFCGRRLALNPETRAVEKIFKR